MPEYDITFPKHANEKGQQISSHRAKRETQETGLKYYHLKAFDKNLHLKVSLNKHLLGPAFHVETRHKDGSKTINDAPHRNFYHGYVIDHSGSFVALSDNRGVVRLITYCGIFLRSSFIISWCMIEKFGAQSLAIFAIYNGT